jgi:serine/threonine-protein kinase
MSTSNEHQSLGGGFKVPKKGDTIAGKYVVEGVMARGGYGVIYEAHQLGVERPVVIKVLPPSAGHDEESFKRFQREARVASSLNHPNSVTIFDFGISDGGLMFIAMERLFGDPLNVAFAREGAFDPERTRRILVQMCEALVAAHAAGIIHRDLKPANVFLCDIHGKKDWVKIIDFGIAKVLEAVDQSLVQTLTQDGLTMGTPGYIAPELLAGGKAAPAADLYAIGVMGYELLTGHIAWEGSTPFEKVRKQLQEHPTDPPEPIKRSPLWPIVQKLMARNPAERYPSAEAALAALEALPRLDQQALGAAPPANAPVANALFDAPTQALDTSAPPPAAASSSAEPVKVVVPRAAAPASAPAPRQQRSAQSGQALPAPAAPQGGGNNVLILVAAIGVALLLLLGVAALVIFGG